MRSADWDKMVAGEEYNPLDESLCEHRERARRLCVWLNGDRTSEEIERVLHELIGKLGQRVVIRPPFYCDYGTNITLGDNVFVNFGCVILDVCSVSVGHYTWVGPYVQLCAAAHPLNCQGRRGVQFGKPIIIGNDVWLGGGTIVLPGVSIGAGSVVGAGSIVTKDIPPGVVAVGNPCRVLRPVTE